MTLFTLFIGLLGLSRAEQPIVDLNAFVSQNSRLQIEQLKNSSWTANKQDQQVLWTAFWYSRMNIIAEDPDIFERAIDILHDLSILYPNEITNGMQETQCTVLSHTLRQYLRTDYAHDLTQSEANDLSSICQNLVTETLTDVPISTWLTSWSSPGGSVGIELWRGTLSAFFENDDTSIIQSIKNDWSLDRPVQLHPPKYTPGQVEGQPVPNEPDVEFIEFERSSRPTWLLILGTAFLMVPFRNRKMVQALLTSVLLFCSIEWVCSIFTPPLLFNKPMFQITGWQITPWTVSDSHYETHGDYLRSQTIPKSTTLSRVVIIGASSAHGSNELWEDSFAGQLQEKTNWDVVNLGIGGTTSTGLIHLRDEIQLLNPSALIIYYGHNEVRQFRLMQAHQRISPWQYQTQRLLWQSSVYSTIYNVIYSESDSSDLSVPLSDLTQISDKEIVQLATWNFESNISLICSTLKIPILLIVPPTNYPFAPMTEINHLPDDLLEIQALIDAHPEATTIHSSIKNSIPKVASNCGATLWDVDKHFHQNSPDGTSANGLFWDELHPSALGHQWIARGLQQWLETLPPSNGQQKD